MWLLVSRSLDNINKLVMKRCCSLTKVTRDSTFYCVDDAANYDAGSPKSQMPSVSLSCLSCMDGDNVLTYM